MMCGMSDYRDCYYCYRYPCCYHLLSMSVLSVNAPPQKSVLLEARKSHGVAS